jgi:hypothetical protein
MGPYRHKKSMFKCLPNSYRIMRITTARGTTIVSKTGPMIVVGLP